MSWSLFRKEMHPVVKFAKASGPGERGSWTKVSPLMQSWPIIDLIQVPLHRSISTGCTEIFSFVQFCKKREKKQQPLDLWLTLACTGSLTGTNTHSRTAIVSFVFLAHFSSPPSLSFSILFRSHFLSFTVLLSNGALPWCAMLREMAAEQTGESHFVITKNHLQASNILISTFFFLSWSLTLLFCGG